MPPFPAPTNQWLADQTVARRTDPVAGDIVAGEVSFYRPAELLLTARASELIGSAVPGIAQSTDNVLGSLGIVRYTSVVGDMAEVAADLQRQALEAADATQPDNPDDDRPVRVTPNHVFTAQPHSAGHPAGAPDSAPGIVRSFTRTGMGTPPDLVVMDTGVPEQHLLADWHPFFDGILRRDPINPAIPHDIDTLYQQQGSPELCLDAGHGLFIAGLVQHTAPDLVIGTNAVLDPDGFADDVTIAQALIDLFAGAANPVPVVCLSLGGYTYDDRPPLSLQTVIDKVVPRTSVVVAAAGNDGSDRLHWPAALRQVVAVAAVDDVDGVVTRPDWSNFGPWVNACSLGVKVLSIYVAGVYAVGTDDHVHDEVFAQDSPMATWSGTSFSAPLVAAAIAREVKAGAGGPAPVTAASAWATLSAGLSLVPGAPENGLYYAPPVDPRQP